MNITKESPFELESNAEYQRWRDIKLRNAIDNNKKRFINIKITPPHFLTFSPETDNKSNRKNEFPIEQILSECKTNNYCLYKLEEPKSLNSKETKQLIHELAKSSGINKLDNNICADTDSLTSIFNKNGESKREYIPYSNKKLNWHTDGYYNPSKHKIHSMLLHCYHEAKNGGESAFIDHEIIYILLRDKNPNWIKALSNKQVMTIPANVLDGKVIRREQSGPVFSVSPQGHLHMRYSARSRNIVWHQDKDTLDAIKFLQNLLDLNDLTKINDYIIRHKLKAGEGIISRNVLHCRNAYIDDNQEDNKRLLFRGRFYDELPERYG